MKKIERLILKELYESYEGLLGYTLHSKLNVGVAEIVSAIDHFVEMGVVLYTNDKLKLTSKGKDYVEAELHLKRETRDKFSNIPEEFVRPNIKINEPFLPTIRYVPSEIINLPKDIEKVEKD